jgi:hypothetical protein
MSAGEKMAEMIFGYWVSQAIAAYAELSVADHLARGALTAAEVAQREGAAPDATFRLMRAGVTLGLLTIDEHEQFHATALMDTLRTDAPGSLRALALAMADRSHWLPWGDFTAAVRSGQTQAPKVLGGNVFEYLQSRPEVAEEFTGAMAALTALWAPDVAEHLDTTGVTLAVDVGGANGALVRLLQEANPALRGIVFDRPNVAAAVKAEITSDRLEVVGGDFFERLPAADLYLLKFVLHDWDDESCVKILRRCREAMEPGARIAIIDFLVGEGDDPGIAALMDLNMLAMADGRERSLAEFDGLLANAGLRRVALRLPASPQVIIEAVAA